MKLASEPRPMAVLPRLRLLSVSSRDCDHFWVQVSTTTDGARRCQCLTGCRTVEVFTDQQLNDLLHAGRVKLAVTFPGIGTW